MRAYRDPNKADGRNLRKAIREYLKQKYPEDQPRFTIRATVDKTYQSPDARFEVIFDQDDPLTEGVWEDVQQWINNEWWPQNKQMASTMTKVWDHTLGQMVPEDVPVVEVTVGFGLLHERHGHY